jgi:anti-sigma-K factor RskA
MKNGREGHDDNIQAGEYVLGTLQGVARAEFETRLRDELQLQAEVAAWERRLSPLQESVDPVAPPASLWPALQRRIGRHAEQPVFASLWHSLRFWRGLGALAATLVLALTFALISANRQEAGMDRLMVVLNDRSGTGWIVATSGTGGELMVKAVQPTRMPEGKVCLLWLKDAKGRMFPVGVLPDSGRTRMPMPQAGGPGSRFMVSIEEQDHLPTRKPSDRIVFEGRLTEI